MFSDYDYDKKLLSDAYRAVGLQERSVVYLTGDLGALGRFEIKNKKTLLEAHVEVIFDLISSDGTIMVPTHSWSLCNTDNVFDPAETPSETGVFSEFVRRLPGAVRQVHPFSSTTAYGANSGFFCTNNSLHAYGPNSPFSRMVDANAIFVSVGKPINLTISLVHHAEFMMGVPYRYTKEFVQPCIINKKVINKEFYLYVTHKNVDIARNRNKRILQFFETANEVKVSKLGRSIVQSVQQKPFFDSTVDLMSKNIYAWLSTPPVVRLDYRL